jgi:hypothetical protein
MLFFSTVILSVAIAIGRFATIPGTPHSSTLSYAPPFARILPTHITMLAVVLLLLPAHCATQQRQCSHYLSICLTYCDLMMWATNRTWRYARCKSTSSSSSSSSPAFVLVLTVHPSICGLMESKAAIVLISNEGSKHKFILPPSYQPPPALQHRMPCNQKLPREKIVVVHFTAIVVIAHFTATASLSWMLDLAVFG